jgi:hypothetical protein
VSAAGEFAFQNSLHSQLSRIRSSAFTSAALRQMDFPSSLEVIGVPVIGVPVFGSVEICKP